MKIKNLLLNCGAITGNKIAGLKITKSFNRETITSNKVADFKIKNSHLAFLLCFFCFFFPATSYALDVSLEMPLGQNNAATGLADYIKTFFIFGLSIVGIVALFAFVYGAFRYLVSGPSDTQKSEAKKRMWAVILGLVFLLFIPLILRTINPELISLKEPNLSQNFQQNQETGLVEMPLLEGQEPETPKDLIKTYFIFGLGLISFVALFAVAYGAFLYFISAGYSAPMKTQGRQWIIAGVSGLTLILCAALILRTINPELVNWQDPNLNVEAPGSQQTGLVEMPLFSGQGINDLGQVVKSYFIFGLIAVGLLALFAVAYGGIRYMLSGSSETGKTEGKNWIFGAVSGVALLLCSFLILYTINPALVSLKLPELDQDSPESDSFGLVEMPVLPGTSPELPSEYIRLFFIYGLIAVGLLALFAVAYGGIRYMLSGSSETGKTEGKNWIFGAVSGVALLLCSFLILYTINPALIKLENPDLVVIEIEPPSPAPTSNQPWPGTPGAHPENTTFSKATDEQHFNNRAPNSLRDALNGLPFGVLVTSYDTGNHVPNSQHYLGNAVDIFVANLSPEQIQSLLQYLYSLPQTNQIIHGTMPQYNKINGDPYSNPKYNSSHMRHIHFSVFPR